MNYVDELKKQVSQIDDKVLKMAICSPYIPLEERVNYGNEYVEVRHNNGKIKAQHEINKKELYEQVENEWQIGGIWNDRFSLSIIIFRFLVIC